MVFCPAMSAMPARCIACATGIGVRCSAANMVTNSPTVISGSRAPPCSIAPTRPACTASTGRAPNTVTVAGIRLGQAQQHVDGGRLPGAIRPQERHHLTGCDLQVDTANRVDVPETLVQAGHPDRSAIRCRARTLWRRRFSSWIKRVAPQVPHPGLGVTTWA